MEVVEDETPFASAHVDEGTGENMTAVNLKSG